MTEDFKKWLLRLAGYEESIPKETAWEILVVDILIKAMWAINREGSGYGLTGIEMDASEIIVVYNLKEKAFPYSDHNNSEQQALEKAIEYIFEQTK